MKLPFPSAQIYRLWRGSINSGNYIGWFRLGVRYRVAEKEITQYLSFEVQPTKMAMATDLEGIHREVDEFYPLWRFSFAQKNRPGAGQVAQAARTVCAGVVGAL